MTIPPLSGGAESILDVGVLLDGTEEVVLLLVRPVHAVLYSPDGEQNTPRVYVPMGESRSLHSPPGEVRVATVPFLVLPDPEGDEEGGPDRVPHIPEGAVLPPLDKVDTKSTSCVYNGDHLGRDGDLLNNKGKEVLELHDPEEDAPLLVDDPVANLEPQEWSLLLRSLQSEGSDSTVCSRGLETLRAMIPARSRRLGGGNRIPTFRDVLPEAEAPLLHLDNESPSGPPVLCPVSILLLLLL